MQPDSENAAVYYAEVCLPLALPRLLTYSILSSFPIQPGMRVVVPLKGDRLFTGIIWRCLPDAGDLTTVRQAIEVLDQEPYLDPDRMAFLDWMAAYYLCTPGEVLLAAVPSSHRLSSESYIQANPEFDWRTLLPAGDPEWRLFELLEKKGKLPVAGLEKSLGKGRYGMRMVRQLQGQGHIWIFDELEKGPAERTEYRIGPGLKFRSEAGLDELFASLEDKPDEEALVLKLISRMGYGQTEEPVWTVPRNDFDMDEEEKKVFRRLTRRGWLVSERQKVQPFGGPVPVTGEGPVLSPAQEEAWHSILGGWKEGKPVLLMGVTGSGKTELYIHAILAALQEGGQALLMLPEIAITVQIVQRLQRVFGERLRVYHSRSPVHDRLEVWEGVRNGTIGVVVGVRSAVFLPFMRLGLLVVDEEHDSSYKQAEPAPRYHGRDAGLYRASRCGARILLGSATPSVESYHKAVSGKWHFTGLHTRFGDSALPEVEMVDMRKARRMLQTRLELSETVLKAFTETREAGRQSILFQNRRGYAPFLECQDCGWAAYCPACDVSLTVHQARKTLTCHYCGHAVPLPSACPACHSARLRTEGYGTEKLEESLEQLLPGFRISRMDQDTTRSRTGVDRILRRMGSGDTDILVGTQMVTKGLDFEDVVTVAVFDIDRVLHYPDFRAGERTFQLLSQIAGRAGRRKVRGKVLVQTSVPYHPLFRMVAAGETTLFYNQEVEHRKEFGYPPFSRLIRLAARHPDAGTALRALTLLSNEMRRHMPAELVLGPEAPPVSRIRNLFIFQTLLKIPGGFSPRPVKEVLSTLLHWVQTIPEFKGVHWTTDVDPV